jgi:pyruvate/2-oxoacid:ferredoxin oxidoreductase beta subunit/Pyruvate/2-oxoacid:ferredoxin oxidoreductase gamma subunit/ferredoxin
MLFGRNAQEAGDLALIARRVAEASETPFFNVQDGFLTTHTLETLNLPEPELMREFIGAPGDRLRNLFDPHHPLLSGPVQNQDSYMKGKVAQRYFYDRVEPLLADAFSEFSRLTGRQYGLVRPYRMEDAEYALVGMGSMMETAEATVDYLRQQGRRVGAVTVTSFRPFPAQQLLPLLLPCKAVAVIERTDVPLAESNPLTTEIKAALAEAHLGNPEFGVFPLPLVYSGVAGLGGRDLRPGHFVAAADAMAGRDPRRRFVLGVKHPDALQVTCDPDVRPAGSFSLRGHSVGGFGSVTTNKVLATVASDLFGVSVQAFPKYGSEKKGLPTNYFLTLADRPIRLHAELSTVEFVAIQDRNAFLNSDPLAGLRAGGTVLVQSDLLPQDLWQGLPLPVRKAVRERELRLHVLDAQRIARESASRADLQVRMQGIVLLGAFLRLTPFRERAGLDEEQLFTALRRPLEKYFGKRGEKVVEDNLAAVRRGYHEVAEVLPPAEDQQAAAAVLPVHHRQWHCPAAPDLVAPQFCDRVVTGYNRGRDEELEADEYAARSLMPPSSAILRSFRHLAPEIPVFTAAKCVGCMECVNQCPDTAILAKAVPPAALDEKLARVERRELRQELRALFLETSKYFELPRKRGQEGGLFAIFVDPDKCKGCGECVVACGSHDALRMASKKDVVVESYDLAMDLYHALPETPAHLLNEKSLGDMMLASRSLLYAGGAGSCMGCGEATAIRLMLAATGFVYGAGEMGIVAATGCNTVFGSTYPFNPFAIPWTNSLFENAPADAMGIRLRWDQEGHPQRRLWVIGGDGAMFDIGLQSLSRMLASGMDIKVLVLDTQVYSNTGGQASTATFTSQDAKMAAVGKAQPGKRERRKELAQVLMAHPNVFVAQTTAAHLNHFYKAVLAANEFPGPAVLVCYTTCQPEHGVPDDQSVTHAKMAVESRAFPLLVYDPRAGERIRERLSLRSNPALKEDWMLDPKTGQPFDFVSFARTEGRFARHFDGEGRPDEPLLLAQQDRLDNWRRLQELAGLR